MGYWPSSFGQDGLILAKFFFCVFMDRDEYMFRSLLMNLEVTSVSHGRADGLFIFYQSVIIQFLLNFLAFDYTLRTKTASSFTTNSTIVLQHAYDSCQGEINQDVACGKSFSFSIKRLNTEVLFLFRDPSLKTCGLIA